MNRLTDDMTRLAGEREAMRDARHAFIRDLAAEGKERKHAVSDMQHRFRKANRKMARDTKADRLGFLSNVKFNVSDMLEGFHSARMQMGRKGEADRFAFLSELGANVAGMKASVADLQASLRDGHKEMGKKTKDNLMEFVFNIKSNVSDLQDSFRNARVDMANRTKSDGIQFVANIKREVGSVKQAVSSLLKEFGDDISGGHEAWFGSSAGKARAKGEKMADSPTKAKKTKKS